MKNTKDFLKQPEAGFKTGRPANRQAKKGQASLELTVALIIFILLLVAGVRTFLWLNLGLVGRQVSYDNTRVAAASTAPQTVAPLHNLDGVAAGDLEVQDVAGQHEVGFNEPLNANLNLVITSY